MNPEDLLVQVSPYPIALKKYVHWTGQNRQKRWKNLRMVFKYDMIIVDIDIESRQVQIRQSDKDKKHTIISSFGEMSDK